MDHVIVSRHPAAIEFIAEYLRLQSGARCVVRDQDRVELWGVPDHDQEFPTRIESYDVITGDATPEDVRGKIVYGTLPLGLAQFAAVVYAVEYRGSPPRGVEYTLADMVAAEAYLAPYVVRPYP